MLRSVEGIYRDGKVELLETPEDLEEARVIVTFLPAPGSVDLPARGIGEAQAAELRARLQAFAADWERPEIAGYQSASEVVRAALRLLEAEERDREAARAEVRQKIQVGLEQIRRGEVFDGEAVFDELDEEHGS